MPDPQAVEAVCDVELFDLKVRLEMAGRRLARFHQVVRLLVVSSVGFDGWVAKRVRGFDESPAVVKLNCAVSSDGE